VLTLEPDDLNFDEVVNLHVAPVLGPPDVDSMHLEKFEFFADTVPEPATVSLFLLGGIAMFARMIARRRD
jgi:hypothetical protein